MYYKMNRLNIKKYINLAFKIDFYLLYYKIIKIEEL